MRQEQGAGDVASRLGQFVRNLVALAIFGVVVAGFSGAAGAAPYAAIVMDARTGQVLYAKNADARLYPASLTKMLTLYITFAAIERGDLTLDTLITVSKNAAAEPPSRLGLRAGQRIALRHLIRAAAVKSANDAATAIGDHIGGTEAGFAAIMNRTAKQLGMNNSSFRNANGLTRDGHLSTARDMTILGRHLFYDFPQYYNIFSRRSTDAGLAEVNNTNRKFLDSYQGADGIKTGYTGPAGFNLTASAQRGNVRIIATIFGGTSTAQRNAKMAELLDLGFAAAPASAAVQPPVVPAIAPAPAEAQVAQADAAGLAGGKILPLVTPLASSPRPKSRPGEAAAAAELAVAAMQDGIAGALAEATAGGDTAPILPAPDAPDQGQTAAAAPADIAVESALAAPAADPATPDPTTPDPTNIVALSAAAAPPPPPAAKPVQMAAMIIHTTTPLVAAEESSPVPTDPEVVTRISTSGGRQWGVNIGRFDSEATADRALMKTMLAESASLGDGLRKIVHKSGGYDANFMGLTQDQADLACRRLQARGTQCFAIGP